MKNFVSLCFLVGIVGVTQGYPGKYGLYYPKRSMMFGSYYSNPMDGFDYVPQGQMTAVVSGDTVATNTYSGQRWQAPPAMVPNLSTEEVLEYQPPSERVTEKQKPIANENEADAEFGFEADKHDEADSVASAEVDVTTEAPVAISTTKASKVQPSKKVNPKRKAKKPVKQEEEKAVIDDEEDDDVPVWPLRSSGSRGGSGIPGYNTFFPIFIGGAGSTRSRTRQSSSLDDQEDVMPSGSATAIANSFSTGKGGVATSHATSFGDPMAAAFFRNAGYFGDYEGFVKKNKNRPNSANRD